MATTTVTGRTIAALLDGVARICSEALGGDQYVFGAGVTQEAIDADPMVVPLDDDFAEHDMPAATIAMGAWSPVLHPGLERLTLTLMGAIWVGRVPLAESSIALYDARDALADAFIAHAYAFQHLDSVQSVVLMGGPGIVPRSLSGGNALFLTLPFTAEAKLHRSVTARPE